MRSLCLSFLFLVLSLAALVPASLPSAAQDKTFAVSILVEHNGVRQKYNVPPLTWDDGLAKLAQDWANKIAATGAMPPAHRASGQNLFWGTADQWLPKDVLEVWEAESKNYDRATNTCAPGKFCVHFTQVVWWTTTRVGCGKAKGTSKDGPTDFFVCDYSPPGNEVGRSPFPIPPTATTTPIVTPSPVAPKITPAPIPTPASTPNTNTECEQKVQQLTAEVAQLKQQLTTTAKLATPTPTPQSKCATSNKYGIEFVQIPAGSFTMGGSGEHSTDESPGHEVTIRSFCLGKYEVTQAQWQSVMGSNPSEFKDCDNCPVETVSWDDAQNFIKKLNESNDGFTYRLPTEAEWEYACRAGGNGSYYGNLEDIGWYIETLER